MSMIRSMRIRCFNAPHAIFAMVSRRRHPEMHHLRLLDAGEETCRGTAAHHASIKPTSASVVGVCRECWLIRDLSLEAIEREAEHVLQEVIPGGRFFDHVIEVTHEAGSSMKHLPTSLPVDGRGSRTPRRCSRLMNAMHCWSRSRAASIPASRIGRQQPAAVSTADLPIWPLGDAHAQSLRSPHRC